MSYIKIRILQLTFSTMQYWNRVTVVGHVVKSLIHEANGQLNYKRKIEKKDIDSKPNECLMFETSINL